MKLRPYQQAAVDATFNHLNRGIGNPLSVLPTGTGKSLYIAGVCTRALLHRPKLRILVLAHVKELVQQNSDELKLVAPLLDIGVYSAGLNSRDTQSSITFASIQSIAKKWYLLAPIDLVIIDEAHMLPHGSIGQYNDLIARLRGANPKMKVVGTTATPYRLSSGRLDEGEDRIFERIVYSYSIRDAVKEGYLTRLISKRTALQLKVDGVKVRGGEYVAGELEAAVDTDDLVEKACNELIEWGEGRKSWIVFCSGIKHSEHVAEKLREKGVNAIAITSNTTSSDREFFIEEFKAQRIQALVGANIFTTGFNAKLIDLIAMMRPTLSTALYVQMLGRGTRSNYAGGFDLEDQAQRLAALAAGPKPDCLVLDFAGNIRRHGPVDAVEPPRRGAKRASADKEERALTKECPGCQSEIALACRECPDCGHEFAGRDPSHDARADATVAVMTEEVEDEWLEVTDVIYGRQVSKSGNEMLVCSYYMGMGRARHYCLASAQGPAGYRARSWLAAQGIVMHDGDPLPSPDECRAKMKRPTHVQVTTSGKYTNVKMWFYAGEGVACDDQGNLFAASVDGE